MRIWLDQVREEPFNWDATERIAPETLERSELLDLGPVTWRGQVLWADPGYYLRAHLSYDQTLSCDRCLQPIHEATRSEVELMFVVEGKGRGNERGEHELHEQDMGVVYLDDEVLETAPILVEQLQLNIPMKPLCRADCKGLCPECGADLNALPEGRCTCRTQETDPRWGALAALKDRLDREP
jgi:DUF177 domain-containing protein